MRKLFFAILFLVLTGCAAKQPKIYKEYLLETSNDTSKPEWVFKSFWKKIAAMNSLAA